MDEFYIYNAPSVSNTDNAEILNQKLIQYLIRRSIHPRRTLLKNVERIETLTELGLTFNQARAYLTLIMSGPISAKKLSENSKITRQDIYRVMPTLEQTGIIEKIINNPTTYKAIPIRQATRILLQRKNAENHELQRKTKNLIDELEKTPVELKIEDHETQVIMITGKENVIQKLSEALTKTQKTIEVITSTQRFPPAIISFKDEYQSALEKGVNIQIATQEHLVEKTLCKILRNLTMKSNFEVRFFPETPEAIVTIFDGKEASVTLSATANTAKASALWSNDPSFVALSRSYFITKWNKSTKLNHAFSIA
jgi:sugar-specific transcriptional regulator TrmB